MRHRLLERLRERPAEAVLRRLPRRRRALACERGNAEKTRFVKPVGQQPVGVAARIEIVDGPGKMHRPVDVCEIVRIEIGAEEAHVGVAR